MSVERALLPLLLLAVAGAACLPPRGDAAVEPGHAGHGGADAGVSLLEDGRPCVAHAECRSGRCAQPCEGDGLCVPAECVRDADCLIPGAEATLCCSVGRCDAVPGPVCGDRTGGQGAACGGRGGDTACSFGLSCLAPCVSTSYCAADCSGDVDCAGEALACLATPGGRRRCVVHPDRVGPCTTDADCDGGQVCAAGLTIDAFAIRKTCRAPIGPGGLGTPCGSARECAAGFCFYGTCTAACDTDPDCACPGGVDCGLACLDVWLVLYANRATPARLCHPAQRCRSSADCDGPVCAAWPERQGWSRGGSRDPMARSEVGEECETGDDCASAACWEGRCLALCEDDTHCESGEACAPTPLPGPPFEGAPLTLCR